jgi:hypothetical protein
MLFTVSAISCRLAFKDLNQQYYDSVYFLPHLWHSTISLCHISDFQLSPFATSLAFNYLQLPHLWHPTIPPLRADRLIIQIWIWFRGRWNQNRWYHLVAEPIIIITIPCISVCVAALVNSIITGRESDVTGYQLQPLLERYHTVQFAPPIFS